MQPLPDFILYKREQLTEHLRAPMVMLASACATVWEAPEQLDQLLARHSGTESGCPLPSCELLYALNPDGIQRSANISQTLQDRAAVGQDLSNRPYLTERPDGTDHFSLSEVYISKATRRSCVTAICRVEHPETGSVLGYIGVDFRLSELPQEANKGEAPRYWIQTKGDPSVRQTLFMQERVISMMDQKLDDVLHIIDELMTERGILHSEIHLSGSRATLWPHNTPFRYQIHMLDEILDPSVSLAYPACSYSPEAMIPANQVLPILQKMKRLRLADEVIYLRDCSINLVNGMIGLHFSCDGQHYMPYEEFLQADDAFWFGELAA